MVGVTVGALGVVFWLVGLLAFWLFALTAILLGALAIHGLLGHWPEGLA